DRCGGAAGGGLRTHRRMARAEGGADGPVGWFGASKVGTRCELHHAAAAAGRHLERGAKNRARVAPARWSPADCGGGRRHGVLKPAARPHGPAIMRRPSTLGGGASGDRLRRALLKKRPKKKGRRYPHLDVPLPSATVDQH